jgi:hypothetical protein
VLQLIVNRVEHRVEIERFRKDLPRPEELGLLEFVCGAPAHGNDLHI